jgi:TusA-related sulfurtransferase
MSQEITFDFRGEDCPGPLIKTIRKIGKLPEGSVVTILTDNERCVELIDEAANLFDLGEVSIKKQSEYAIVTIKRKSSGISDLMELINQPEDNE